MAPVPPSSKVPTPLQSLRHKLILPNWRKKSAEASIFNDEEVEPSHSAAFTNKPAEMKSTAGPHHVERLALIEDFALGLYDHKPPSMISKSGIRLSYVVCLNLTFRFILIVLLALASFHMSAYRITWTFLHRPVQTLLMCATIGWVTIAVVAGHGSIKLSKAPLPSMPMRKAGKQMHKGKGSKSSNYSNLQGTST